MSSTYGTEGGDRRAREAEVHEDLILMLRDQLGATICDALADPDVVEIMRNNAGDVWVDRLGAGMQQVGRMTNGQARLVILTVGNIRKTPVHDGHPRLSCSFPIGLSRFQANIDPMAPDGPVFAIRKRASRVFTLDDLARTGVFSDRQVAVIRQGVDERWNIVISGGTGSGKTTNINAVLDDIGKRWPGHRIAILEDTYELQTPSPNHYRYLTCAGVSMKDLLFDSLRMRPDRIVVGEIRDGYTALDLIDAWNSGHGGGASSIHADSPPMALAKLERLARRSVNADVRPDIAEAVQLVVQVARGRDGRRTCTDILRVTGLREDKRYDAEHIAA